MISCGSDEYNVVPALEDSDNRLSAAVPAASSGDEGTAACASGDIDLLIKVWDNTVTANSSTDYAMDVTCWVEDGTTSGTADSSGSSAGYALSDATN